MNSSEKYAGLLINGVDTSELITLLQHHFGISRSNPDRSVTFSRSQIQPGGSVILLGDMGAPCLSLKFDKRWKVSSVIRHEGVEDQEIEELNRKIDTELRQSNGIYIHRESLFYTVAVNSAHRHDEAFQILPVPQDAAKPDTLLGPHPFLLEIAIPASTNPFTNANRGRIAAKCIKNVLAVLLQFNVSGLATSTQYVWVFDKPSDVPPVSLHQIMYTCFDPGWSAERLTDISGQQPSTLTAPSDYYAKYGISGYEGLELPANFDDQFRRYFALSDQERQRFDRASYWYAHAYDVWHLSKSASYVALVTSIECMLVSPRNQTPCEKCGKVPADGPTKQFREFVEAYVPGAGDIKSVKNELYSIRSRMAHGDRLMSGDVGGWHDPRRSDEDMFHRQLTQLVQFALVNWLASV